jgi:ATP-dependent DNA helicase PIF1
MTEYGAELSRGQQYAIHKFQQGENIFLSGPGGSGKSYVAGYFVHILHEMGRIHQVTSTTGCSSILLSNQIRIRGRPIIVKTIHSWSGIRLGKGSMDDLLRMVLKHRRVVKEWRRIKTLILDECSMLSKKLFTVLEYIARKIRNNASPFGGIQIVFLGDFFQLPPVGDPIEPDTMDFCFESPAWSRVFPRENHIELEKIYRQSDTSYQKILNEIRRGELSPDSCDALMARVGVPYDPELHGGVLLPMKLFPTRNQVQRVNDYQYGLINEIEYKYQSNLITNMKGYVETREPFEPEVWLKCRSLTDAEIEYESQNLVKQIPVEGDICLKIGVPVMCLVNLEIEAGIANGSVGVIVDFVQCPVPNEDLSTYMAPIVKFGNGQSRMIQRYTWQHSEYPIICVSHMPLSLSYASSIHKMQGANLDASEMNLGSSVFSEHQTYVALSRVKTLSGVYLSAFHPQRIRVNPKVVQFYANFLKIPEEFVLQESVDGRADLPHPLDMSSASASACTDDSASASAYQDECPICLDSFEKKHKTDCGHFFCYDCMHRLLNSTLLRTAPCPICRSPVTFQTFHSTDPVKKKSTSQRLGFCEAAKADLTKSKSSSSWLKVRKI